LEFVLIVVIASIPVALPAVLSVTMALGALRLSHMKAVVTKLESIEEMAGIDVLCCDKTGTLTQNQLSLGQPFVVKNDPILMGALASKAEDQDPIDLAIIHGLKNPDDLKRYKQENFVPFDPVRKRSDAAIRDPNGTVFYVTKGAPQVIMALCHLETKEITDAVNNFAAKGHRTLGVARSSDGKAWEFLGLLPLFDPLREDAIETIKQAQELGVKIKMLTGDNIAIAKEIAGQLHIGDKISSADKLSTDEIEQSDGFAQIFPEHKYEIVKALQSRKHLVGMTGDGVNDSPALKQAEVGIAVSGATDAARAAASLVLLAPGLSVIIQAIQEARRIFERMNSYTIYRIAETLRIMFFIVLSMLVYQFYPVTATMIIILALLNDIPILTIASDNTLIDQKPVKWQMKRILTISTGLSVVGISLTFLLLYIAKNLFHLPIPQIQSFIFLKLSLAGHLTLFVARTRTPFFSKPHPSLILFSAILSTQILAACIVGFGIFMPALPWIWVGFIWGYSLVEMLIEDGVKLLLYRYLGEKEERNKTKSHKEN
jgi:H+-transporting ATPase